MQESAIWRPIHAVLPLTVRVRRRLPASLAKCLSSIDTHGEQCHLGVDLRKHIAECLPSASCRVIETQLSKGRVTQPQLELPSCCVYKTTYGFPDSCGNTTQGRRCCAQSKPPGGTQALRFSAADERKHSKNQLNVETSTELEPKWLRK